MSKYLIGALIVGLLLSVGWVLYSSKNSKPSISPSPTSQLPLTEEEFENPKKSAHYETNTPSHGSTLPAVPVNVVIDFNFDLDPTSSITIEMKGKDHGVGKTTVDKNRLSLRREMDPSSPNGVYTVKYNACWPDKTCHDGHFQFKIDRSEASSYEDMTGKKEITINLKDTTFNPKDIKISKGTKIIWVNNDGVEHYINTESHPAHTYLLDMNSKALDKGQTYSYTFDKEGIYPYHCSAHADSMTGSILVE